MNTSTANQILINANRVNTLHVVDPYEFVFNDALKITECMHIKSLAEGIIYPIYDFRTTLQGVLFELNHVRVNPHKDNNAIIGRLTGALADIGVNVYNTPSMHSMAVTYRPLGEITERVRFYFSETGNCVFLCPNAKLKSISKSNVTRLVRR